MVHTAHITTAEQLLEAGDIGRCELIRGHLHMMTPAGDEHSRIAQEIAGLLRDWARPRKLGVVYGEGGFLIERNPDTVRAPDVAFIPGVENIGSDWLDWLVARIWLDEAAALIQSPASAPTEAEKQ